MATIEGFRVQNFRALRECDAGKAFCSARGQSLDTIYRGDRQERRG